MLFSFFLLAWVFVSTCLSVWPQLFAWSLYVCWYACLSNLFEGEPTCSTLYTSGSFYFLSRDSRGLAWSHFLPHLFTLSTVRPVTTHLTVLVTVSLYCLNISLYCIHMMARNSNQYLYLNIRGTISNSSQEEHPDFLLFSMFRVMWVILGVQNCCEILRRRVLLSTNTDHCYKIEK